ncbi:ATP synthase E chain-domain-containing protein [Phascolomyces articulosus]|uniref:ATP synthase F(0) complex subunit e, mitochondrial n=1 Tax=Phascolomyces articulosus TaxID=60185 RepID=A0AAD5JXV1_9FUNG|nr:ATP synthase E chain-domain-containing protein [Phascolomyces articulosus]
MVNRAFVNVGRWSALAFGLVYGYTHNSSLQKQEDAKKQQLEYERKEQLIEKARLAYAAKQNTTKPVVAESADVDSPDFDFEKFIAQLEAQEKK